VSVSDIHPVVDLPKIFEPPTVKGQEPKRSNESHPLNGHVDAVAKDASAALPGDSLTSAEDAAVLSSDQKADKTLFAANSDFERAVNGYKETFDTVARDTNEARVDVAKESKHMVNDYDKTPIAVITDALHVAREYKEASDHVVKDKEERVSVAKNVARDATDAGTGAQQSSVEDRRQADDEAVAADADSQQVTSLSASVEQQTDIKPVNPEMAIFNVLHRQQASRRQSGCEDNEAPGSSADQNHSSTVDTPTTVVNV